MRVSNALLKLALLCLACSGLPVPGSPAIPTADYSIYLPLITQQSSSSGTGFLIIDHHHTDVNKIPEYWIEQARKYTIHYAHTSHGSQVLTGLKWLEQMDPKFNVEISVSGNVALPPNAGVLRIYDGNNYPGDTYITPEMYWETSAGINKTRSVADTGWFNLSLWTWCGQMSYYKDSQIQTYLDRMTLFEDEYPQMQYIFYTGHTDGSSPGSLLWQHNEMVRQYISAQGKVLFDFADIETYAPNGDGPYYNNSEGYCQWCQAWCEAHPANFECRNPPENCAHTHGLACTLKGQAFWWLLARLAGWDGIP